MPTTANKEPEVQKEKKEEKKEKVKEKPVEKEAEKVVPDPVMTIKKRDKVIVGGFSPTTRHLYPWDQSGPDGYDIWGCNELGMQVPRMDVLFEMHDRSFPEFVDSFRNVKYIEWMKQSTVPIMMIKHYDDIPMSIPYPLTQIMQKYGNFFNNTISYMLALAIYLKYKEIQLIGVDMSHPSEWDQRASVCLFLGMIHGMYLTQGWPALVIPPESLILKCPILYGYQASSPMKVALEQTRDYYGRQAAGYAGQLQSIKAAYDAALGMSQGTDQFIRQHFTIPGKG